MFFTRKPPCERQHFANLIYSSTMGSFGGYSRQWCAPMAKMAKSRDRWCKCILLKMSFVPVELYTLPKSASKAGRVIGVRLEMRTR